MKKSILLTIPVIAIALLLGCSKPTTDKDGVPLIKESWSPTVDGNAMTPEVFFNKYCNRPELAMNSTCASIKTQVMAHRDSGRYLVGHN